MKTNPNASAWAVDTFDPDCVGHFALVDVIFGAAHWSLFSPIRSELECVAPVSARKGD